jgi:hypothetical protein
VLLGRRPGPVDHRAAFVQEALARLERLLLVEQDSRKLLDLAPLLRRRFGREPAQRLRDKPLPLGLREGGTLRLQARDDALIGGPDLLRGVDLLGPELRELGVPHRRRARDQLVDRFCVAAVPGPQRLDLGDPALVLGDDPGAALVRDAEQRPLGLIRLPSVPFLGAFSVGIARKRPRLLRITAPSSNARMICGAFVWTRLAASSLWFG